MAAEDLYDGDVAYSDPARMLRITNQAIAQVTATGVGYNADGQQVTRSDLRSLLAARDYWTTANNQAAAVAANSGGAMNLARTKRV